jgi:hypothetical protein
MSARDLISRWMKGRLSCTSLGARETSPGLSPRHVRSERSPLHDVRQHAHASGPRQGKRIACANSFLTDEHSRLGMSASALRAPARQPSLSSGLPSRSRGAAKAGGARRNRTDDLLLAKQALSQLSYGPLFGGKLKSKRPPEGCLAGSPSRSSRQPAPPFGLRRGSLLSRSASEDWWAWEDLNFRPHAYQARALTS